MNDQEGDQNVIFDFTKSVRYEGLNTSASDAVVIVSQ